MTRARSIKKQFKRLLLSYVQWVVCCVGLVLIVSNSSWVRRRESILEVKLEAKTIEPRSDIPRIHGPTSEEQKVLPSPKTTLIYRKQNEASSNATNLFETVKILCWIMTSPPNHKTMAAAVKDTWGRRCNYLLFVSSEGGNYFLNLLVQFVLDK